METSSNAATNASAAFFDLIKHPVKSRLFLLKNLPAAYFSGVTVRSATPDKVMVSVPYKWFTRNPFRCTYFACLSMAAEMCTGILAMASTFKRFPKVGMLVTGIEGRFYKKAVKSTLFICVDGNAIRQTVEKTIMTGERQSIKILSSGFDKGGDLVSEFWVTWSFGTRQK